MTRAQFAMAVRADEKWVENAGRLLSRRFRYTAAEAQWLGLVRILNQDVGLTLNRSAQVADEALEYPPHTGTIVVGQSDDETAGIAIDIARFHSIAGAALAAALDLGGERRRGRPRASLKGKAATLRRSASYGVDLDLLRAGLRMSPGERLERLDENAAFIAALHPVSNATR